MEIDVKKLYMTGYVGMILLNIIGGAFLILAFMGAWFSVSMIVIQIILLGGLFIISLIATVYITRLRDIMFSEYFKKQKEREAKRYLRDMEDLNREQDNV